MDNIIVSHSNLKLWPPWSFFQLSVLNINICVSSCWRHDIETRSVSNYFLRGRNSGKRIYRCFKSFPKLINSLNTSKFCSSSFRVCILSHHSCHSRFLVINDCILISCHILSDSIYLLRLFQVIRSYFISYGFCRGPHVSAL